jgi:HD-like signal output (HDOD) protein
VTALQLDDLVEQVELLPKLPDTILQLVTLVNNPDGTFQETVDTIRRDQALTTELLRLCDSAYFGQSGTTGSIDDAVRYVGTAKLMELALAAHAHALLGSAQPGYGLLPGALWVHSVGVALGCQALAARTTVAEKGCLFLAGLLHDVGKVVLDERVVRAHADIGQLLNEERLSFLEVEQRAIGVTHPEVGEQVARRWGLPEPIPRCIRYHHEPALLSSVHPLVDVVHLADAACLAMGVGIGDDSQMYRVDEAVLTRVGLTAPEIEELGVGIVEELKLVQELFQFK